MTEKKRAFTRKTALSIVLLCAAALLLLIIFRWYGSCQTDLSTPEGRESFLSGLGWEIDRATEEHRSVIIPDTLEGVMEDYNKMQLSQGYDLSRHLGEKCEQYTYRLTNYSGYSGTVLVTLYVQGREIVAGDIHTTSIDGFMHGIKRTTEE